jgi:tight adherence protein B
VRRSAVTRVSLLAATLAALLSVSVAVATASSGLRVTKLTGPVFPERTLVLSLPHSRALHARGVRVAENGLRIRYVRVEPASKASRRTFGVVLVLDTSCSMQGKPLTAARDAERSFEAQRNSNEELGAIDFNRTATTVLPLTTSQTQIDSALAAAPQISCGTRMFDAVARAEAMLRAGHISSGSIIVLSDGADTGSATTLTAVARRALAANVRIYTVGLDDRTYQARTLTALATAGGGEYVEAKTEALAPLFRQLGRVLSSEYLLSYRSLSGPAQNVRVDVTVGRLGTATTTYRTPRAPVAPKESTGKSIASRILTSWVAIVVVSLVLAAMIALLVIELVQPRRSGLPLRIAEFVSIRDLQRHHGAAPASQAVGGEPTLRKDWWGEFRETLEIARISVEPEFMIVATAAATILVFIFILAVTGSVWWGLFALGVPYLAREFVLRALKRQRSRFAEQLPEALQVISSALRSGHSFAGSLAVVVESASEPMRSELQRVVADEQLGMPIQRSLAVVADRMASSDVDQLALVAELQRQAGGDMAEVIDRVAESVRERFDLRRLVQTLTTQGRMSRWIVSALPIVILLVLQLENPHYFHPLVASTGGKVVVGLAAAWAVVGSLVIKRIVEIEV